MILCYIKARHCVLKCLLPANIWQKRQYFKAQRTMLKTQENVV
jgi:hypothetical protein